MKPCVQLAACAAITIFQSADAMVASSTRQNKRVSAPNRTSKVMPDTETDRSRLEEHNYSDDFVFEVTAFQELQRSTGSEILDDDLQYQIDLGSEHPDLFLDAHVSDASSLEKVAMSSIPEQLPRPAVNALRKTQGLSYSSARVTPEEEIELAKMIQKGVKLHKLRSKYEEKNGRKPSRTEWSKLAGLSSANELRREVANYRRAKQLLVSANIGLVHAVVKTQYSWLRKKAGLSFEEFVQEGSLGLLRAAELFDPGRGLRFSTYATIWIKGSLSNSHIIEPIKLPQRERTKYNKIVKAYNELVATNGGDGDPTLEEIAGHLGLTVSDVLETKRKMSQVKQVLSLDYEYATLSRSGGVGGNLNILESDKAFTADADLAEMTNMHADVVAAMARNLDAREARLMRLRYGLTDGPPRTIRECAEAMGLSQTRVQNIAQNCLKKLREAAEAESLEEYLLTIA